MIVSWWRRRCQASNTQVQHRYMTVQTLTAVDNMLERESTKQTHCFPCKLDSTSFPQWLCLWLNIIMHRQPISLAEIHICFMLSMENQWTIPCSVIHLFIFIMSMYSPWSHSILTLDLSLCSCRKLTEALYVSRVGLIVKKWLTDKFAFFPFSCIASYYVLRYIMYLGLELLQVSAYSKLLYSLKKW